MACLSACRLAISPVSVTPSSFAPVYISPSLASERILPETTIAIRYQPKVIPARVAPALFTVSGDRSGLHAGVTTVSDDHMTILFKPTLPFSLAESVTVHFDGGPLGVDARVLLSADTKFSIIAARPAAPTAATVSTDQSTPTAATPAVHMQSPYATVTESVPFISITHYLPTLDTESIFLMPSSSSVTNTAYLLILDGAGELQYYRALPTGHVYGNFMPQGNGHLTYFEGTLTSAGGGAGLYREMDSAYRLVRTYEAGNGYKADAHELLVLPDGHALLTIYDTEISDMSEYGGRPDARFIDSLIQELDTSGNVILQWRASDHVPMTQTYEALNGALVDPYHGNSIDVLPDGNLLLSFRHLSQMIKVDRHSGAVIWRMGGKNSDFNFTNDSGFSYQHHATWLANGHLSVFDNGNQHAPPTSRAVEYEVDQTNMLVTRTWQFARTPSIFGAFMGNVLMLPDGGHFIGWGGPVPAASLVSHDGLLQLDLQVMTPGDQVYRWYKAPFTSTPDTSPVLVIQSTDAISTTMRFSWNGATEVGTYRIDASQDGIHWAPVQLQPRQGFETSTVISRTAGQTCFYRVVAISKVSMQELKSSNSVHVKCA